MESGGNGDMLDKGYKLPVKMIEFGGSNIEQGEYS